MSTSSTSGPLVSVEGLRKSFGSNTVLDGIDFTAERGSVTVLVGPSGSGKTTLLRSLNVLDRPDAGRVRIGDVELDFAQKTSKADVTRLRAQSGMVFQAHNLFPHRTVLQNVTEGPRLAQGRPEIEVEDEARALLVQVGLGDKVDQHPYQLSGGQQQRVGIARALAMRPQLMLFDEPTSALDPELVGEVLKVMKNLAAQGWTMVVVTHEIRFAQQVADQVLFLDGGVLVERGAPQDVLANPQSPRLQQFLARILDPL